ncbi:MAG: hypothetical protein JWP83_52 [Mycobacterium sp.]|nr:hypothetical protein [Mycobacterium sp.]
MVGAGKVPDNIIVGRDRLGARSSHDCLMRAIAWSEHLLAVQLAEWIGDKLEAGAVGVIEVQRGFAAFI